MKPRKSDPMQCPSGYTIDLYCCREGCYSEGQGVGEGPRAYYMARRDARQQGWTLHKDGFATCPACNGKKFKSGH